ncbi:MAG: hypothetical protein F9K27_09485 [Anaerolineae bacterium]|nr:MAG: hypothetical protein F9K27_09485 [Anaerolineae bacterium]
MLRFLLWLMVIWGAVFAGWLVQRDRADEYMASYLAAVLPDEGCVSPCWSGIRPGKSSIMEVHGAVSQLSGVQEIAKNTWLMAHEHIILLHPENGDLFIRPSGIRLGDFLLALGEPDYQTLQFSIDARQVGTEKVLQLYYEEEQITLFVPVTKRLSVESPIESIRYGNFARPFNAVAWQGCVYTAAQPFGEK